MSQSHEVPPSPAIRWGIVGFGWVARDFAVPAMRAAGHQVGAVFDPSPTAAAAAAAQVRDITAHASLEALLGDPSIDAIYVATPNHRHRAAVEAALQAGRPVLCEKPMAASLADAEAIARAVECRSTLYGTAFDQRHHPAHAEIRNRLSAGRLGTVTAVRIVYACWLGQDWSAAHGPNWRIDPAAAGGGALMDLAPHGLDLVEFLLGEPIEAVTAAIQHRVHHYTVDDGAMIVGRTASGVLVSLHVAYNHSETLPRRRLELLGTGGLLLAENTMGQDAGGQVTLHDAATGAVSVLDIPDAGQSPFTRQMRAFAAASRGVGTEAFDVRRDLHTMRLLHRAYQSASAAAVPETAPARVRSPEEPIRCR